MIERDRIGPLSVAAANQVKQWWLSCQANVEAFYRSGVDLHRLHKVHVPFFPSDPHLKLVGRTREPGPTRFYHIGVISSRKDQVKMLMCFLSAFRPRETSLTIKTTTNLSFDLWHDVAGDPAVLSNGWDQRAFGRDVTIVNEVWSEGQMLELHRRGDVYVTLSHGEGWEMSAYDALLSGNRLVYSASGGPEEFASEGDLLVPPRGTIPCDPGYGWGRDAHWFDYDRAGAIERLREAHQSHLPKTHRRSWETFTAADVGMQMRLLLDEVSADRELRHQAASRFVTKWMGSAAPIHPAPSAATVSGLLAERHSCKEFSEAGRDVPLTPQEVIHSGRTEVLVVYRPNLVPHGLASHAMYMRNEHPSCSWVACLDDVIAVASRCSVRAVVFQVQWGFASETVKDTKLAQLRAMGVRVVVNYHHAENTPGWLRVLQGYKAVADQIVFHHPDAVRIAGTGIYFPLQVPKLKITPKPWIGGLVFTGFADPSRCIDKLVGVAERLREPIYGYSPGVERVPQWYPESRRWTQFRPMPSYLNENSGISEVARHSVALFARLTSSKAYSSASARFCMAAGIPVVVESGSKSYEDLSGHVAATVSYADHVGTDRTVRLLMRDKVFREDALERQRSYAERASVKNFMVAAGIS